MCSKYSNTQLLNSTAKDSKSIRDKIIGGYLPKETSSLSFNLVLKYDFLLAISSIDLSKIWLIFNMIF